MALYYNLFEECMLKIPRPDRLNEHGCPSVRTEAGKSQICVCPCHDAPRAAVEASIKRTASPSWSPVRFD